MIDSDIDGIIRRIDTDGDSRLSFQEFCEGIIPRGSRFRTENLQTSPARQTSPLRQSFSPSRTMNF